MIYFFQSLPESLPEQPQLGAKEMAELEKELELDLENLDVNDAVSIYIVLLISFSLIPFPHTDSF